MKTKLLLCLAYLGTSGMISAQTIWTGPSTTFTKAPFADHTMASNQDFITSNVILTRANTKGIFNIVTETAYDDNNPTSPADTEWSFGTTANIGSLTFEPWELAINNNPPGSIGLDMVLHLITDDIYIDIKFLSWGQGNNGGGSVTYERSTGGTVDVVDIETQSMELFPNPSNGEVAIIVGEALGDEVQLEVFGIGGNIVETRQVVLGDDRRLDMSLVGTDNGMYMVRLTGNGHIATERLVVH